MSGAGVGGGSLVYANTLYEPMPAFYTDPQWRSITDWREELAPFYDQAKRMLGVSTYPRRSASDMVMKQVADEMGVGHTFHPTPVGVFFGRPGEAAEDPYFGGAGPARRGCTDCGECMTGCRHNAKNTLVKNYLYLAERAGAVVHPMNHGAGVRPAACRRIRGHHPRHRLAPLAPYVHRRAGGFLARAPSAPPGSCTGCGRGRTAHASPRAWAC
jgi:cholesterol oxidase